MRSFVYLAAVRRIGSFINGRTRIGALGSYGYIWASNRVPIRSPTSFRTEDMRKGAGKFFNLDSGIAAESMKLGHVNSDREVEVRKKYWPGNLE